MIRVNVREDITRIVVLSPFCFSLEKEVPFYLMDYSPDECRRITQSKC